MLTESLDYHTVYNSLQFLHQRQASENKKRIIGCVRQPHRNQMAGQRALPAHQEQGRMHEVSPTSSAIQSHLTPCMLLCCRHRVKPYTLVKCAATVTIGLLVGLLAVALGRVTEGVITAKNRMMRRIIHQPAYALEVGVVLAGLAHIGYSVALVLLGSCMVRARRMRSSGLPVAADCALHQHPCWSGLQSPCLFLPDAWSLPCMHACMRCECSPVMEHCPPGLRAECRGPMPLLPCLRRCNSGRQRRAAPGCR